MDSPGTGDSDTTGPRPIVSDDLASSEHEVHTSDVSSTDEDDFQPFALPDEADELADGPLVEYLPLVEIPAPIPLAVYPAYDLLLDAEADSDIDLFDDDLLEDDEEGEALIADGGFYCSQMLQLRSHLHTHLLQTPSSLWPPHLPTL